MLNTVCLWRFELSWWFRVTRSSAAKRVARRKKPLIYGVYPLPEAFDSPLTNGNNTIKADRANLSAAMGRQVGLFCRWIKSGAQCAPRWNSHINYECAPYPRADEAAISPTFIKAQIPSLLAPNSDRSSLHYTVSLKVYLHQFPMHWSKVFHSQPTVWNHSLLGSLLSLLDSKVSPCSLVS